ncbi:phytoene/squalene synthase family protein [Lysobacter sp. D1-1-M9]|uniref:phytoene/squalene synthase family protein n=1 Tax=Novilysobacter longmucuonensis TaxID=3098603 RepID=UPI002FC9B32A
MSDFEALASFIDKWRARWPEWMVAEVFVPRAQRELALAWAALQQELTDAAWGGSDPQPGAAKLAWWQEELRGWARGARRHPLGLALHRQPAPWAALAMSLPALQASRERASDDDEVLATLRAFAEAVAAVDAALFGAGRPDASSGDAALVSAVLLQSRCMLGGDAHLPLSATVQTAEGDPRALWAAQLRQRWPDATGAPRVRRIWAALARGRLERSDAARPLSHWTALRVAWRAARG